MRTTFLRAVSEPSPQLSPCGVRCVSTSGGTKRDVISVCNAAINMGDFNTSVHSHKHIHTHTVRLFPLVWSSVHFPYDSI